MTRDLSLAIMHDPEVMRLGITAEQASAVLRAVATHYAEHVRRLEAAAALIAERERHVEARPHLRST